MGIQTCVPRPSRIRNSVAAESAVMASRAGSIRRASLAFVPKAGRLVCAARRSMRFSLVSRERESVCNGSAVDSVDVSIVIWALELGESFTNCRLKAGVAG